MALAAAESRKFRSGRPVEDRFAEQPHHGLVDHGGRGEGVARPLPLHHPGRDVAQLLIYPGDSFPAGAVIPRPRLGEDDRQFGARLGTHPASENS